MEIIAGDYSRYQINAEQFDNLFTDNVNTKTLDALSESAAAGNLDCIDMLHNLALRHDDAGKRAEDILYDLFSGKKKGKLGIDEDIQLASHKLYQTACHAKDKNNRDMNKLFSPSKLLYIAGSAITDITQKRDVSTIFRGDEIAQSQLEQFDNIDLWSSSRMLMTDEINAILHNIIQNISDFSLNYPIGLIEPSHGANLLSEQIIEKIKSSNIFDKVELFPINTGDHWVLFALYHDEFDRSNKCVVFNSLRDLSENAKNSLSDSAKIAGVSEDNIEFINGDMQKNVPNGCGVFVIKGIELLSRASEKKPVDNLKKFVDDFSKLSTEDQVLFNIQTRRQLYKHSICRRA
ncbi:type III secretion system effector deubiquitinase SseL [Citrobacter freundii]|nr:type III secretion system effector deubiquitinase SseL [Citrobacter freundii]